MYAFILHDRPRQTDKQKARKMPWVSVQVPPKMRTVQARVERAQNRCLPARINMFSPKYYLCAWESPAASWGMRHKRRSVWYRRERTFSGCFNLFGTPKEDIIRTLWLPRSLIPYLFVLIRGATWGVALKWAFRSLLKWTERIGDQLFFVFLRPHANSLCLKNLALRIKTCYTTKKKKKK